MYIEVDELYVDDYQKITKVFGIHGIVIFAIKLILILKT